VKLAELGILGGGVVLDSAVKDTLKDVKKGLDVFKDDVEKSLDNINNIQP